MKCEGPDQFRIDTKIIKEKLDALHSSTVYSGGISDIESRREFRRISAINSKSKSLLFGMGRDIVLQRVESLKTKLALNPMENSLIKKVFGEILYHPFTIKVMVMVVIFCGGFCVYIFWSIVRMIDLKGLRNPLPVPEQDTENVQETEQTNNTKGSRVSYIYAAFSHTRMDINLNKEKLEELETIRNENESRVEYLTERLNHRLGAESEDRKPPPTYFEEEPSVPPSETDSFVGRV